jgi:hypothetical protein
MLLGDADTPQTGEIRADRGILQLRSHNRRHLVTKLGAILACEPTVCGRQRLMPTALCSFNRGFPTKPAHWRKLERLADQSAAAAVVAPALAS